MNKKIIGILMAISGGIAGALSVGKIMSDKLIHKQRISDKHFQLFMLMNQWVRVKQEGKNLASYFEQRGYTEIAIYGMHSAGETLVEELRKSNIKIKYGIDKNAEKIYADFDVVTPEELLDDVDVIVVTSITFFEEVKEILKNRVGCPIVSLEDIIELV